LSACDILLSGQADENVLKRGRVEYQGLSIAFDKNKIRKREVNEK